MPEIIKISVCVVTYNQENTIAMTLDSILSQNIDSKFEIVVFDDNSTDKTPDIIRTYTNENPNIIRTLLRKKNVGPYRNFIECHQSAVGKYVCHCDGDDYFLQNKLKTQESILDSEPDCNVVFHRMMIISADGVIRNDRYEGFENLDKIKFTKKDLIRYVAVGAHSSKMYRNTKDFDYNVDFNIIDYYTHVLHVGNGYARFASCFPLGVYRDGIGISHNGLTVRIALADTFLFFSKKFPEYRQEISSAALTYFIANVRLSARATIIFFKVWLETFHPMSLILIFNSLKMRLRKI